MSKQKNKIQITNSGHKSLTEELDELKNVKRPKLVERLSRARDEGDLSENSDYTNARDELEFLDGRIDELTEVLDNAEIIKATGDSSNVAVGTRVKVGVNGSEHLFEIVGEWEADPAEKKISHTSPLGEALIGKSIGDEVQVDAPAGKINYKVLAIE